MTQAVHPTVSLPGTNHILGGRRVFVVAEIGKGFIQSEDDRSVEEYLKNAIDLVDAAVDSKADAVKFQTHVLDDEQLPLKVKSPHFPLQDRYGWVKRNENATPVKEFWTPLKEHCDKRGIMFFSTPMSRSAARKLEEVGEVHLWKVGSGDVQDYVLLNHLIASGKPIVISTGMVSLKELDQVVEYIGTRAPLVILYCVSQYPCPPEVFNLSTLELFREKYPNLVIGFSDHSVDGHEVDLAAVKLGARVIEKHLTFDRSLWGSDHKASITPQEMKKMIEDIRTGEAENVDIAPFYGVKNRELEGAENIHRPYFQRALVAGRDIARGSIITEEMVYSMRPIKFIKGIPANRLADVVGKKTSTDLRRYDPLNESVLF